MPPPTERKILLLGPSGAGKSTLCNVIFNQKVELGDLTQPAKVSSRAIGQTSEISNYWCDNSLVVTDTIGFDDSRFEPTTFAKALGSLVQNPDISYEKIILCMKLGRVSQPARVYLRLLKAIFDEPTRNMILYISGCEDGTTVDEFIQNNSSSKDVELAELINSLVGQKKKFKENQIEIENIIAGSLHSHKDAEVDAKHFLEDRQVTFTKIKKSIDIDIGKVKVKRSEDLIKSSFEWIEWMLKQNILKFKGSFQTSFEVFNHFFFDKCKNVENIYGECTICFKSTESKQKWIITDCYHRFHADCFCVVESRICPSCKNSVKDTANLPN